MAMAERCDGGIAYVIYVFLLLKVYLFIFLLIFFYFRAQVAKDLNLSALLEARPSVSLDASF